MHSSREAFSSLHTQHGYSRISALREAPETNRSQTLYFVATSPGVLRSCPIFALVTVAVFCELVSSFKGICLRIGMVFEDAELPISEICKCLKKYVQKTSFQCICQVIEMSLNSPDVQPIDAKTL